MMLYMVAFSLSEKTAMHEASSLWAHFRHEKYAKI